MNVCRPLRLALFFYECIRLFLILGLWSLFLPLEGGAKSLPCLMYAAPNALFPLIALFMWRDLPVYRVYLGLYTAGKIIILAAFYAWGLFAIQGLVREGGGGFGIMTAGRVFIRGTIVLAVGDILSILGGWILNSKIKQAEFEAGGYSSGNLSGGGV
jgi:hypothetical protein